LKTKENDAMGTPFHVQGRLIERHGPVIVRDETRRVDAESRDEALRIAQVLGSDGFTVWVWAVDSRSAPAEWNLVDRIDPPRPTAHQPRRAARRGAAGRGGMATA
jgi:hypothetical protein